MNKKTTAPLSCGCSIRCQGERFHGKEADRIGSILDSLGPEFSEDGPVRWILRQREAEERERAGR